MGGYASVGGVTLTIVSHWANLLTTWHFSGWRKFRTSSGRPTNWCDTVRRDAHREAAPWADDLLIKTIVVILALPSAAIQALVAPHKLSGGRKVTYWAGLVFEAACLPTPQ